MENVVTIEQNLEIKPYDIDVAGHVNNAVYMNWFEDLRIKLFEKIIPLKTLISKGLYPVVASTTIDYKRPLYLFDKPVGKIRIDKFEKGIWYLKILIELENKIVAKASQKCVLIDLKTHKMVKDPNSYIS